MLTRRRPVVFGAICIAIAAGCAPTEFTFEEESISGAGGAGGEGSSSSSVSSSSSTSSGSASSSGGGGAPPLTACGDGVVTAPEVCDDGNLVNGDACAASCRCGEVGAPLIAFSSPDGHCYFIYNNLLTWLDARNYCTARGATLAIVTSAAERDMISAHAMAMQVLWIGGEDSAFEGTWTWIDGTPWTMYPCDLATAGCDDSLNLWNTGEPNDMNDEDCATLDTNVNRLNDLICTNMDYPVCENVTP